jgi:pyrimidine-specific ribonucleoside hydrolase
MPQPDRTPPDVRSTEHDFTGPVDTDPVGVWRNRVAEMERAGLHEQAARQREIGPPPTLGPSEYAFSPKILAVEIGGDPGGALAVAFAALKTTTLKLVIAIGPPESARFTRHLLDLLGRPDVGVVTGAGPSTQDSAITGLVPTDVPAQSPDVAGAVNWAIANYPHVILWGNSGPLTDLATALQTRPDLADRLGCAIGAGPLDTPQPAFASDPTSAAAVFARIQRPAPRFQDPRANSYRPLGSFLITAQTESHRCGPGSAVHRQLGAPGAPAWARLLHDHVDQWFRTGHPTFSLYPVLVASELVNVSLLSQELNRTVAVDEAGQVLERPGGTKMMLTADDGRTFFEFMATLFATPPSPRTRTS